jgi:hypothetical protein
MPLIALLRNRVECSFAFSFQDSCLRRNSEVEYCGILRWSMSVSEVVLKSCAGKSVSVSELRSNYSLLITPYSLLITPYSLLITPY